MNLSLAKSLDRVAGNVLASAFNAADGVGSLFRAPLPPIEDVRGIAVIKFWGLGNWALLRPVVRDLSERWPRARLLVVTLASNLPLVDDLGAEVAVLRPTSLARLAIDLAGALRRLRRLAPEMSLDFEQFSRAGALLARAAGIPQRLGFASGGGSRDGLYTVRVPFRRDAHASRSFRDLAEAAGTPAAPYVPGALAATEAGLAEVAAVLGEVPPPAANGVPLVVLHPGSGDNFPGRRWSETGFSAVARHAVAKYGARVVVTGSASEAALCERVARGAGHGVESLAGRLSLRGLVALLSRSAALVSNDTGPVHLASALRRPVLALFGPNTPVLYGPLSPPDGPRSVSLWKALPCSPCLTEANYRSSRCRIHSCMSAIATGEATAALDRLLGARVRVEEGAPCPDARTR